MFIYYLGDTLCYKGMTVSVTQLVNDLVTEMTNHKLILFQNVYNFTLVSTNTCFYK